MGVGLACGAREKNCLNWRRERASARQFSHPGRYLKEAVQEQATQECQDVGMFGGFVLPAATIAWLSQKKRIHCPLQRWPQLRAAASIANSSCHWMDLPAVSSW